MVSRVLLGSLAAILLICLGLALQYLFVSAERPKQLSMAEAPSATPEQSAASTNYPQRIAALRLEGIVEYRHHGAPWSPLQADTKLDLNDEIRTGPRSLARIQLGSAVIVELSDDTAINIAQLSATLSRIRLQDGRVVSEVQSDTAVRFRVQVQGTDAEASTSAGRFAVMRRAGTPAVFATERGNLDVSASGQAVRLNEGEQTIVNPGSGPSKPTKLPATLLLKLGKPPPSRLRAKETTLSGETSPGAVITVGHDSSSPGAVLTVGQNSSSADQNGHFASSVALVEGANEIRVEVQDVLGRRSSAKLPRIVVDAQAPRTRSKVVW